MEALTNLTKKLQATKQQNNNNNNPTTANNHRQHKKKTMAPNPPPPPPRPWDPEMEEDYQRILTVGEECINEKELKALIIAKGRGVDEDGEITVLSLLLVHAQFSIYPMYLIHRHSKFTRSPQDSSLRWVRAIWPNAHRTGPVEIRQRQQMHLSRHPLHILLLGSRLVRPHER